MIRQWLVLLSGCLLWTCPSVRGQTLSLSERATGATSVTAEVGEAVEIAVLADLGRFSAAGVSLYIRVPTESCSVVDRDKDGHSGVQPFRPGSLFSGGMEAENELLTAAVLPSLLPDQQMLVYSVVLGPGNDRSRRGEGLVATFALRLTAAVEELQIAVESPPIHDTRLVLDDGRSERRFTMTSPMSVTAMIPTAVEVPGSWAAVKASVGPSGGA